MVTRCEECLAALFELLPVPAGVGAKERNPTSAKKPPEDGKACLFDGKGDPIETYLLGAGKTQFVFEHRAELEFAIEHEDEAVRRLKADAYILAVEAMLEADRTLGGLADFIQLMPPDRSDDVPIDPDKKTRGTPFRFLSLQVRIEYTTTNAAG
jgi:hypothetical protein